MAPPPITILTSGIGFGIYIPSLLIQRQLQQLSYAADVAVLEAYYTPEHRRSFLAHRDACHGNFALAQLAHRMAKSVEACLDETRLSELLTCWARQGRDRFIMWSGFWLPLMQRYHAQHSGKHLYIDRCRIDAEISASFKVHEDLDSQGHEVWLWNWAQRQICHEIRVTDKAPLPFDRRPDRLVLHGGGWGLGNYHNTADDLSKAGYALDMVIHSTPAASRKRPGDRCFMVDPAWHPWERNIAGELVFPPMSEVLAGDVVPCETHTAYHALHDVIRHSKAIVSKPGGCTLIDSLNAATPVVLLEPYGYAETCNGRLWEHLGFGITYRAWQETNFDPAVLAALHANIMHRTPAPDYVHTYARRLAGKDSK